jgi:hypothetical protein
MAVRLTSGVKSIDLVFLQVGGTLNALVRDLPVKA